MQIKISNENVDIGMEKKEIAIMWAMRKLGYSEEQTQQVLDLSNKAYQKKSRFYLTIKQSGICRWV